MNDPTAARIHAEVAVLLQAKDQAEQQLQAINNQLLVLGRVLEPPKPVESAHTESPAPPEKPKPEKQKQSLS